MALAEEAKKSYVKPDYSNCDDFGRSINGDLYWYNTGLSSIDEIKLYKRQRKGKNDRISKN